jgi:hypothetical protein
LKEERRIRVFENRVLRRIFGPKRDEIIGEWRKIRNEKLNVLYASSNFIRGIKSRRMRWVGPVAHMTGEVHTGFGWGNARERVHLGNLGVNGRIILRLIIREWDGRAWALSIWLKKGTGSGLL